MYTLKKSFVIHTLAILTPLFKGLGYSRKKRGFEIRNLVAVPFFLKGLGYFRTRLTVVLQLFLATVGSAL